VNPDCCLLCGRVGLVHRHHLAGRPGPGRPYFDPDLVLLFCQPCHTGAGGVHALLRTEGLAWPRPGEDSLGYRLRRVGFHARLQADSGRSFVLDPVSAEALAMLVFEACEMFFITERGEV